MAIRFASLGSGSRGNAALVAANGTLLMIDCGFSAAEAARRMQRLNVDPQDLGAILVTHEHADHIAGVAKFARRYGTPIYMTHGTARACKDTGVPALNLINPHEGFAVGDFSVQPYPVPHDACEPCQYVLGYGKLRLGVLSDAGCITPHICEQLDGCDGLLLECNHDVDMLAQGPYTPALKRRVGGNMGHLSNAQAADLLGRLKTTAALQQLAVTHISEINNTPELAHATMRQVLGTELERITLADQGNGLPWMELH